jgi:hypothetical protein
MADYDSGLPIRTEADGTDERVHVKIVDGTNPSVNQTTVDSDKNLHVELHGDDEGAVDRVVALSEKGNIALDGVEDGTTNTNPSSSALIAHDRNGASTDRTHQDKRVTAVIGEDNTISLDIALHDENGQNYDADNPLPVTLEESEGDEICDYQTSSSVAKNSAATHDYTVTATKTLIGDSCWISGSGKFKVEVTVDGATKFVGFNSTANPNVEIDFKKRVKVVAGDVVSIIITNRDNQPQDLYSTLLGVEK